MKSLFNVLLALLLAISFAGCKKESITVDAEKESEEEVADTTGISIDTPDWTEFTHSNKAPANYSKVFRQDEVIRIDIKIGDADWKIMQADLAANISSSSGGPGGGLVEFDPVWVPCSVYFEGLEWYKVGVRYKGNSSLSSTYKTGIDKFSFKLDFDQYESDFPEIKNQRFYGFKQLSLKNNYDDPSLIREKVSADLFRQFGLASSQCAFCAVYVDYGSGPEYFGLYTLVEQVDDTVIKSQYTDGSGNCYKPDGNAATFASGKYDEVELGKQNNDEVPDYSDVKALYDIINSSTRTSDIEAWKTELEKTFDVDIFLKWLAANTTMQNWDTYGKMTHNYYLYNNPASNKLEWIPWDANEAFQTGKQGGALSIGLTEVGSGWPLIRYILDIPQYHEKYDAYLKQFIGEIFVPSNMNTLYDSYYQLLKDFAYAEEDPYTFLSSDGEFDSAIATLKSHVTQRNSVVANYLK